MRDAGRHQLVVLRGLAGRADVSASSLRLLTPRISRGSSTRQGLDAQPAVAVNPDQVGQVVLALRVCGPDLLSAAKQRLEVESVDAAVDLADLALRRRRVLVLDDRRNRAIRPDDAAVAVRLVELRRQNGGSGACRA